ncbi:MAG: hypothetical protein CM15mP120_04920 [Pseudomonadota bacterium]|nr:MAG: hypothetical protein CM15mP120_04920 [Pseudomonadota bacterium]
MAQKFTQRFIEAGLGSGPVIEITGDTRVTRLQTFAQSTDCVLAIGRAFDNDVILDDPYVDPHHGQLVVSSSGVGPIKI